MQTANRRSLGIQHLSAFLFGLMLSCFSLADSGRVVRILDGDTVEIRTDTATPRIRLAGIDAPEKRQAFGDAAKRELARQTGTSITTGRIRSSPN